MARRFEGGEEGVEGRLEVARGRKGRFECGEEGGEWGGGCGRLEGVSGGEGRGWRGWG